jgi:hypothetical protein
MRLKRGSKCGSHLWFGTEKKSSHLVLSTDRRKRSKEGGRLDVIYEGK